MRCATATLITALLLVPALARAEGLTFLGTSVSSSCAGGNDLAAEGDPTRSVDPTMGPTESARLFGGAGLFSGGEPVEEVLDYMWSPGSRPAGLSRGQALEVVASPEAERYAPGRNGWKGVVMALFHMQGLTPEDVQALAATAASPVERAAVERRGLKFLEADQAGFERTRPRFVGPPSK